MSEFKGTPGKWYIDPTYPDRDKEVHIEAQSGTVIASLYCEPMDDETLANAKLCCASKELMYALQELLRFENIMRDGAEKLQYPYNFLKAIDAAKEALHAALD